MIDDARPTIAIEMPAEWLGTVGNSRRLAARGKTVRTCLEDLARQYPAAAQLRADRVLDFFVNWEKVRYRQGLDTAVGAEDRIQIVRFRA